MPRPLCSIKKYRLPLSAALLAAMLLPTTLAVAQTPGQSRTWTDASGKYKVEATLTTIEGDKVTLLRADGRKVVVPLDRLSKADQDYVRTAATTPATATPATGQAAAPDKLPFDAALVADEFQVAVIFRPSQILKSKFAQSLMKLLEEPVSTIQAGIDLAQVDWLIALGATNVDESQRPGTENTITVSEGNEAMGRAPMRVGVIMVSQKPFDRAAIKASPQLQGSTESTLDGKAYWSTKSDGLSKELLFYSDNVLLASTDGMINKMLAAKGSGTELLNVLYQAELEHDATMVVLRVPLAGQAAGVADGHPLDRLMQSMEHAVFHLDVGNAPKLAAHVTTADTYQAGKIKESADAGIGMAKLIATLGLQEQLKDLQVDPAPLTSFITDTLNSFQSSVDGSNVNLSIATPPDAIQRVEQCVPIFKAMAKQMQAGGNESPFNSGLQP